MKSVGNHSEHPGLKKRKLKTPSTAYSHADSPLILTSRSEMLSRNLVCMQKQLASRLKRQASHLSFQAPILKHRSELIEMKISQLKKNREIVNKVLKTVQDWYSPELFLKNIIKIEEKNKAEQRGLVLLKDLLNKSKKKKKEIERLEEREKNLAEKKKILQCEKKRLEGTREELGSCLVEIRGCGSRVLDLFGETKAKLEELMISREELVLSIPNIKASRQRIGDGSDYIKGLRLSNEELREEARVLHLELVFYCNKNIREKENHRKNIEKFNSRKGINFVHSRFLEEQRLRIEFAKRELNDIKNEVSKTRSRSNDSQNSLRNKKKKPPLAKKSINKSSHS